MDIFETDRARIKRRLQAFLPILLLAAVCLIFYLGITGAGRETVTKEQTTLKRALEQGAIHTYALTGNYPQNLEETLYIFGETGTVKIGGKSTNNIDVWDFADETEMDSANKHLEEATSNVYGNGHTSLYADMIDAIQKDRKPYVDAVAGRNALEMVLAIYKSQKDGMPVKLPLTNFKSTDMTGEF